VNWPASQPWQVQYIPTVATRAVFSVRASTGEEVALLALSRSDASSANASFHLPPGTGYTATATFYDEKDLLVAKGTSLPFGIERQRTVTVGLTVSPIASTVVGNGVTSYTGDGSPAALAQLFTPLGMAASPQGDLYIADFGHHAIRRVDAAGIIDTVAGNGVPTSSTAPLGDGGPAAEATLRAPSAVAMAPNGDLLIADTQNGRIRILPAVDGVRYGKTLTSGLIDTVLQASIPGPVLISVAVDPAGNVFVAERHRIVMLTPAGERVPVAGLSAIDFGVGDDGPALESRLNLPDGLLVDPFGNLLFTDRGNHRVRMLCRQPGNHFGIAMASGSVYTIAGGGTDPSATGTVGDGGDALQAILTTPRGLALDARGNLFIADTGHHRIRLMSPERVITTFAGTGTPTSLEANNLGDGDPALSASFLGPVSVVIRKGYLYVSDSNNNRVRRFLL
jgi:sugar lactone lactonase YvrE